MELTPTISASAPARSAAFKWLEDRVLTSLLLVVSLPLLALAAMAIKLDSRGPVLYRQTRVGRHGRRFTMVKLRTMIDGADELRDVMAHLNESDGPLFKLRRDPRVTRVGALLRRTSLDELPQLWNVLRGDMSLVGPRPLPEGPGVDSGIARRRLTVKPGLTGLWQVSGRSRLSWDDSLRLDLQYVEGWSPWLDVKILLKTAAAMVHGSGAY